MTDDTQPPKAWRAPTKLAPLCGLQLLPVIQADDPFSWLWYVVVYPTPMLLGGVINMPHVYHRAIAHN